MPGVGSTRARGSATKTRMGKVFEPKMAWWFLSRRQKEELKAMRQGGNINVGGDPLQRPLYWWIQNKGMPEVGIKGTHYIDRALRHTEARFQNAVRVWVSKQTKSTGIARTGAWGGQG